MDLNSKGREIVGKCVAYYTKKKGGLHFDTLSVVWGSVFWQSRYLFKVMLFILL